MDQERLAELITRVPKEWRDDFRQLTATGEARRPFLEFLDSNHEAQGLVDEVLELCSEDVENILKQVSSDGGSDEHKVIVFPGSGSVNRSWVLQLAASVAILVLIGLSVFHVRKYAVAEQARAKLEVEVTDQAAQFAKTFEKQKGQEGRLQVELDLAKEELAKAKSEFRKDIGHLRDALEEQELQRQRSALPVVDGRTTSVFAGNGQVWNNEFKHRVWEASSQCVSHDMYVDFWADLDEGVDEVVVSNVIAPKEREDEPTKQGQRGVVRTSDSSSTANEVAVRRADDDELFRPLLAAFTPGEVERSSEIKGVELTQTPEPKFFRKLAKKAGQRGTVVLAVLVDERGHVKAVHVVKSIPKLDAIAVHYAWSSRYEPARENDKPIQAWQYVGVSLPPSDQQMLSAPNNDAMWAQRNQ